MLGGLHILVFFLRRLHRKNWYVGSSYDFKNAEEKQNKKQKCIKQLKFSHKISTYCNNFLQKEFLMFIYLLIMFVSSKSFQTNHELKQKEIELLIFYVILILGIIALFCFIFYLFIYYNDTDN